MAAPRPEATLLGLPRELRNIIYHDLLVSDVDLSVVKEYDWRHSRDGFHASPTRPEGPRKLHAVPWVALTLVCRTINAELSDYISSTANTKTSQSAQLTTWRLDVQLERRSVGAVTWRTLPCPPSQLKILYVAIRTPHRMRFWGDGGPMGSVSSLYQLLNAILHCGPHLRWSSPLPEHIQLDELRICVLSDGAPKYVEFTREDGEVVKKRRGDSFSELSRLVAMLSGHDMLVGYVKTIKIADDVDVYVENMYETRRSTKEDVVPTCWHRYGFNWGTEG